MDERAMFLLAVGLGISVGTAVVIGVLIYYCFIEIPDFFRNILICVGKSLAAERRKHPELSETDLFTFVMAECSDHSPGSLAKRIVGRSLKGLANSQ